MPEVRDAASGLTLFDELFKSMQVKQSAKRALWTVPLEITKDLVIGVKGCTRFLQPACPLLPFA